MANSAEKIRLAGNPNVLLCERGTMFGYSKFHLHEWDNSVYHWWHTFLTVRIFADDLIFDPRNLEWLRESNCPVVSPNALDSLHFFCLLLTLSRSNPAVFLKNFKSLMIRLAAMAAFCFWIKIWMYLLIHFHRMCTLPYATPDCCFQVKVKFFFFLIYMQSTKRVPDVRKSLSQYEL